MSSAWHCSCKWLGSSEHYMSAYPTDRRHSRVGVEELRRHLLAADEDRFRLMGALQDASAAHATAPPSAGFSLSASVGRALALLLVICGGVASILLTADTPPAAIESRPIRIRVTNVTPDVLPSFTATAPSPVQVVRPSARRKPRPLPVFERRALLPRPSPPRPLSPGEFGRKSDRRSALTSARPEPSTH
jgi:hypothetical protein